MKKVYRFYSYINIIGVSVPYEISPHSLDFRNVTNIQKIKFRLGKFSQYRHLYGNLNNIDYKEIFERQFEEYL